MRCQLSIVDLPGGWTGRPQQGHRGGPRPSGCSYDQNVPAPDNLPTGPIGCSVFNAAGGQVVSLQRAGQDDVSMSPGSTHKRHRDRRSRQRHVASAESRHDRVDRHDENPLIAGRRTACLGHESTSPTSDSASSDMTPSGTTRWAEVQSPTIERSTRHRQGRLGRRPQLGVMIVTKAIPSDPGDPARRARRTGPTVGALHISWLRGPPVRRPLRPRAGLLLGLLPLRSSKPPRSERFAKFEPERISRWIRASAPAEADQSQAAGRERVTGTGQGCPRCP